MNLNIEYSFPSNEDFYEQFDFKTRPYSGISVGMKHDIDAGND